MTVTAPSPRFVAYAGDGGSGPFPIPFRVLQATDLKAVVIDAGGNRAPLTGLILDGAGEAEGGQATSPRAIAVGETLVLWTDTALVQPADYIAADAFPAETHEAALDRLTLIAQDQRRDLARALSAPLGDTVGPLPDADHRKGMLLTFDAETGDPVTDRDYAAFIAEVVSGLDVGAEVLAAGAAQVALIEAVGEDAIGQAEAAREAAIAEVHAARDEGLEGIAEAVLEGAIALGLPSGGLIDVVSSEGGYDEGWAFTDENGWTTADYHFSPSGTVGQVVRHKIPGADFSAVPAAYRIFEPPPVLPYDINIVVISGQSNSEDADSVPILPRADSAMVMMLDAVRPRHFVGTFGLAGFTNAIGREFIASQNHWGGNLAPAVGDILEQLIEDVNGKTYAEHGRAVVPVSIGMSSSSYAQIGYGSGHFTTIEGWFAAAKVVADAAGKSIGIIAGAWLHGADSYDNSIGQTAAEVGIDTYWSQVMTYLQIAKLNRTDSFPIGFVGTHAHFRGSNDINPFVAEAEAALIAANPSKYFMVNGEGQFFFDGRRRGFAGSGVHHSARESAIIGACIGWWVHEVVSLGRNWNNCIPTFARTGAAQVTMGGLPNAGWEWDFYATGLPPTLAQANHGWFFYDPSSPSTELALTRPPYAGAGGTLIADFVSALPTNLSVRYGARASGSTIAGNDVWRPMAPILFSINGEDVALHRNIPALNKVIV